MKIRPVTMQDVDGVVAMAERFYPTSGYTAIDTLSREQAAGLAIVTMQNGVMLVAERDDGTLAGMACVHIEPFLFNPRTVIAQEIVWWVEPDARGGSLAMRLLKATEDASRARGATVLRMATLPSSPEAATRLLTRSGFRASESYFVKELA